MPLCEMCGKEARLVLADVEGVELNLCSGCIKYGTVKKRVFAPLSRTFKSQQQKRAVPEYRIVANYSSLIKAAREKREMNQEEFARFLNEQESVVAKWEAGTLKPRLDIARKLKSKLGVNLLEEEKETVAKLGQKRKGDLPTLGDFIKVRKRKTSSEE